MASVDRVDHQDSQVQQVQLDPWDPGAVSDSEVNVENQDQSVNREFPETLEIKDL